MYVVTSYFFHIVFNLSSAFSSMIFENRQHNIKSRVSFQYTHPIDASIINLMIPYIKVDVCLSCDMDKIYSLL